MYVLEPTVVIIAILAIRTDMAVSTVKIPTVTTLWTTSLTSALLEYQLLSRTQAFAMIIVAVFASFTLAVEMIVVANFLMAHTLRETSGRCRVGAW